MPPVGMLRDTTVTSSAQLQEEWLPVSDTLARAYLLFSQRGALFTLSVAWRNSMGLLSVLLAELVLLVGDRRENSPSCERRSKGVCAENSLLHLGSCLLKSGCQAPSRRCSYRG